MTRNYPIFLMTLMLIAQSCALREAKEARFHKDEEAVMEDLKSLKDFDNARIKWSSRSFDKRTIDVLVVELMNGKNMVDSEAELRELGKEAMRITLDAIENQSEYERFEVIFIRESRKGVLTNTFTRSFQYSPEEVL